MKESLARTLGGYVGLGESPAHDAAPVDRLHAAGSAQRAGKLAVLGFELVRLKLANVSDSYPACRDGLADALMERSNALKLKRPQADIIAAQVLMEYVIDFCPTCGSRGEIPDPSKGDGRDGAVPMKVCPTCSGIGVRRYTDSERAEAIGMSRNLERAFAEAHAILSGAIRESMWNYRMVFKS